MLSPTLVSFFALATGCAPYSDLAVELNDAELSHTLEAAPGRTRLSGYDGYNDPSLMLDDPERQWAQLPRSGRLPNQPWSGSYWPKYKGGIAYRWQTGESHTYDLLSEDEVQNASEAQLRRLSPAEKYDLFVGNTDYPLTLHVQSATSPTEATWTGYCHGWTIASSHYEEPRPVTMISPSGQKIRFGSSDVKALLTFFKGEVVRSTWAEHEWSPERKGIGTVCGSSNPRSESCTDTNAGAFHIVIANRLGLQQQDVFMDVEPTYEKWNQPIFGYRTRVLDERQTPDRGPSAVREIVVATEVDYAMEIEPTWDTVGGTRESSAKTVTYTYTLQLNTAGEITGGEWVLPLQDGTYISLQEAWIQLTTMDENGDGRPDRGEDEAKAIIWEHFKFPDYLWIQDGGEFSDTFRQATSGYEFLSMGRSSRQKFYEYFAPLAEIYEASIGR